MPTVVVVGSYGAGRQTQDMIYSSTGSGLGTIPIVCASAALGENSSKLAATKPLQAATRKPGKQAGRQTDRQPSRAKLSTQTGKAGGCST